MPAAPPARAQTDGDWPSVTVAVINYNGLDYLDRCLGSLRALAYPSDRVEILFIDNASADGSVAHVREAFPEVRVVVNDANTGFAPAVNQAAQAANGTYLALINNDAEADPSWLRTAVHELENERAVACVASKILRENREQLDYAGGQMAFYGHGFAKGAYEPDRHEDTNRDTLFASGGAMVVRTRTFIEVGGFDDSYFAFFEDVDFGWRLNVLGHRVRYVPSSKVYHRHHGTIERFGFAREAYLLERNALATVFKNYGEDLLARILPTSILLTVLRGIDAEGTELPDYRITDGAGPVGDLTISGRTGAHLAALRDFALSLDDLSAKRAVIQSLRKVEDRALMRLFEASLRPNVTDPAFLEAFDKLVRTFDLDDHARPRSRVLALTDAALGEDLDGDGVRAWEVARLLAHEHEVVLVSTEQPTRSDPSFRTMEARPDVVDAHLGWADVVIVHGFMLDRFPQIAAAEVPLVVDLQDPVHLEGLGARVGGTAEARRTRSSDAIASLNRHLERADLVTCATQKQRDFWLGQLSGRGRVNPATFDQDSSLRSLLAIAPTGIPQQPPERTAPAIKGVVDGIAEDDFVLLWAEGEQDWLDPATLVRAVARAAEAHPDVRLYLAGAAGATSRSMREARRVADELGVLGRSVVVGPPVAYDRRADLLLDADVGVTAHDGRIEGAFTFRSRFLDYVWAGLPVLATDGDAVADAVRDHDLGLLAPPGDVDALAAAIGRLRTDEALRESHRKAMGELARELTWDLALAPLSAFVRQPQRAADRAGQRKRYATARNIVVTKTPRYYAVRTVEYLRTVGLRTTLLHLRNFVSRRLRG